MNQFTFEISNTIITMIWIWSIISILSTASSIYYLYAKNKLNKATEENLKVKAEIEKLKQEGLELDYKSLSLKREAALLDYLKDFIDKHQKATTTNNEWNS